MLFRAFLYIYLRKDDTDCFFAFLTLDVLTCLIYKPAHLINEFIVCMFIRRIAFFYNLFNPFSVNVEFNLGTKVYKRHTIMSK